MFLQDINYAIVFTIGTLIVIMGALVFLPFYLIYFSVDYLLERLS